jgi:hypothetical protein
LASEEISASISESGALELSEWLSDPISSVSTSTCSFLTPPHLIRTNEDNDECLGRSPSTDPTSPPSEVSSTSAVAPSSSPSWEGSDTGLKSPSLEVVGRHRRRQRHRRRGTTSSNGDDHSAIQRVRQKHSAVERRYRDALNQKLERLSRALEATDCTPQPLHGGKRRKARKSDILTVAIDYVYRAQLEIRHMSDEIRELDNQVRELRGVGSIEEKMVRSSDMPRKIICF